MAAPAKEVVPPRAPAAAPASQAIAPKEDVATPPIEAAWTGGVPRRAARVLFPLVCRDPAALKIMNLRS